ncbi:MAG: phosphate regulon transcriptional regulator PhoB [Gammaproteobacteria bacterium]|jgi:two-component system phosphate regulon response regulator PhoB
MASPLICVIEDDPAVREMLRFLLVKEGWQVCEAVDTVEADKHLLQRQPNLILLDWMLPGMSGLEYARKLAQDQATREIPVIMLTARGEEEDKVRSLESGVDDYVTKPFSPRELLARIRAVLRRVAPHEGDERIEVDGLSLDPVSHRVTANDSVVGLGAKELRLLHFFMTHPDRVYTRGQLLDRVWGMNAFVEERTVDVYVLRLRKALEKHGYDQLVQTVRGVGYRFSSQV